MRRPPSPPWTSSELRIGGSPSSNWTATTRPATPAFIGAGAGAAGFGFEPFKKKRWFAVRRENCCEFRGHASSWVNGRGSRECLWMLRRFGAV